MPDEKVAAAVEKVKGKKAKVKKLDAKPQGTKAKKLPKDVIEAMKEAFPKAKLTKVRVHTGGDITEKAKSINAKAFTVGDDIFFSKKGDASDPKLIAHELAHVIQSGQGKMPKEQTGKAFSSK